MAGGDLHSTPKRPGLGGYPNDNNRDTRRGLPASARWTAVGAFFKYEMAGLGLDYKHEAGRLWGTKNRSESMKAVDLACMLLRVWKWVSLFAGLATVGLACAGPPERTYPGAERPLVEIAILRQTSGASVIAIDGVRVSASSWSLLPGAHELLLRVRTYTQAPNMSWTIWSYCRVRFDAVAGEQYESVVRIQKEMVPDLSEKVKMEIGVAGIDERMRAHAYSCSGKRPSADR